LIVPHETFLPRVSCGGALSSWFECAYTLF
jgi:hypothetical protein